MATMTKQGARQVTQTLDRIANLFQTEAQTMGISPRIANDFALRCDMLADHIEKQAGLRSASYEEGVNETGLSVEPPPFDGFDANNIGDEKDGPLLMIDSDEPWMEGEFTQEKFQTLRELQQAGDLGPNVVDGLQHKASVVANLRALASLSRKTAAADLKTLPGMSAMQFKSALDSIAKVQQEVKAIEAQYAAVFAQLKDLSDAEKKGMEELKKAALQLREKGQYAAETEKAILEFTAYLTNSRPGIEQMIASDAEVKPGQKAGDFFGRVASQCGDEVAAKVKTIYEQTKEDLTESQMALRGFKLMAKQGSVREAGLLDVVIKSVQKFREWLVTGVKTLVSAFTKRTLVVKQNSEALATVLDNAKDQIAAAVKSSKTASADHGFDLSAK